MTGNLKIAMNGSMLDEQPSGVGVYSFNVINQLSELYSKESNQLTVFSPTRLNLNKRLSIKKLPNILQSSRFGKVAACTRFIWNTICYNFLTRDYDVRYSTTTHGSFTKKNQVITIHDLLSLRFDKISAHQRFYFRKLLPFMISRSNLIITISETTKRDIIKYFNCSADKIKVVYNGYDEQRYVMRSERTNHIQRKYGLSNYILAVGPTYAHKNFDTLLAAFANLSGVQRSKNPLVIAGGKAKYVNQLKDYTRLLGISDTVHFLGYVPIDDMQALYAEACFMVFPSLYEGFGIPLLEAMASGCPLICSNTSSMPEVCNNAVQYFSPTDAKELGEMMQLFLDDEVLRSEFRIKGLAQAKLFSWKKTAEELKYVIETHFKINNS